MSVDNVKENAFTIIRRLKEAGYKAYFVGGFVRDKVMGIEPKDYDIVTDASPEVVSSLFKGNPDTRLAFGILRY